MGCVYKIDFENGKSYIGYTRHSAESRIAGHKKSARAGSELLVHKALRKFGLRCEFCVLFESEDEDALTMVEIIAIAGFKTQAPGGYNLTSGGEKTFAHHTTSRQKMSAAQKGKRTRLGAKFSEESKRLMRERKLGRKLPEETKKRMSESRKAFYGSEENLARLREERRSREPNAFLRKVKMACLSALGHAKRSKVPFSELKK